MHEQAPRTLSHRSARRLPVTHSFTAFPGLISRAGILPGPPFTGLRNRRPSADAVNCLLSFCYGLLTKELLAACIAAGFDPYIGLLHRPRFGWPALALDLAQEFRPLLAESTMLTLINNEEVASSDFLVRAGAFPLTADGRKAAIRAWERRLSTEIRHPLFSYKVTYRRAIDLAGPREREGWPRSSRAGSIAPSSSAGTTC